MEAEIREEIEFHLRMRAQASATKLYRWVDENEMPLSIGRLSGFAGNAGILLRALAYALLLGREGMPAQRNILKRRKCLAFFGQRSLVGLRIITTKDLAT